MVLWSRCWPWCHQVTFLELMSGETEVMNGDAGSDYCMNGFMLMQLCDSGGVSQWGHHRCCFHVSGLVSSLQQLQHLSADHRCNQTVFSSGLVHSIDHNWIITCIVSAWILLGFRALIIREMNRRTVSDQADDFHLPQTCGILSSITHYPAHTIINIQHNIHVFSECFFNF